MLLAAGKGCDKSDRATEYLLVSAYKFLYMANLSVSFDKLDLPPEIKLPIGMMFACLASLFIAGGFAEMCLSDSRITKVWIYAVICTLCGLIALVFLHLTIVVVLTGPTLFVGSTNPKV